MTRLDKQINYWAHMLDEAFDKEQFLCEDKEGKNINRAEKWIKQNHPELIGKTINGRMMSRARDVVTQVRHDIPSARLPYDTDSSGQRIKIKLSNGDIIDKGTCKYLPGICRIYLNDLLSKTQDQAQLVKLTTRLSDLVNVIAIQFDNDFREDDQGRDFNGMSFDELESKYGRYVEELKRREREEAKSNLSNLTKNEDYDIVSINSFYDAKKFSQYAPWCVTVDKSYFNHYTANGENKFYFAIRKDFKDIAEDDPSYATSMLAILIRPDGSMDSSNGCTARLNNGGRYMDPKEVQDLLGVDFYKTFKPNNADKIWKKILKNQVPQQELTKDNIEFCKTFGCVAIYSNNEDEDDSSVVFRKLMDGKIITFPYIDKTTTYINNRFVTIKDGKFVDAIPKTIQNMPKDIKGEFVIPYSVVNIGEHAFYSCSDLTSVTIPDSVTSIGSYAFCGCTGLTSVMIPDSIMSIGNSAFLNCTSLTSMTIPDSIKSIGNEAFAGCSRLTSVMIPDSIMSIGNSAFNGCSRLADIMIPNSITSIGNGVFYSCTGLTSVTIPDSVTSIGSYAFCHCRSLMSMKIPDGVTSIGDKAFAYCSDLTSVTIPDSVMSISNDVFDDCHKLTNLTFEGKTLEEVKAIKNYPFGIEDESIIKCKGE